jgi:hypothetical protein
MGKAGASFGHSNNLVERQLSIPEAFLRDPVAKRLLMVEKDLQSSQ